MTDGTPNDTPNGSAPRIARPPWETPEAITPGHVYRPPAPPALPDEPGVEEERPSGGGTLRWLLETVLLLAAAFVLAQVVRTYVVQPFVIPTGSMEPTIAISDRVLVNKFLYRFQDPVPGDIVVFDDPTGETPALIKRVIAVPGQTVDIRDGQVLIDGTPIDEPYVHGKDTAPGGVALPYTVAEGEVWLMGDNRPNSKDSRWLGPQPFTALRGVAFATYWPMERIGGL